MEDMFSDNADFSEIANIPIKMNKVVQKAHIGVNEEGSEAISTGEQFYLIFIAIFLIDQYYSLQVQFRSPICDVLRRYRCYAAEAHDNVELVRNKRSRTNNSEDQMKMNDYKLWNLDKTF